MTEVIAIIAISAFVGAVVAILVFAGLAFCVYLFGESLCADKRIEIDNIINGSDPRIPQPRPSRSDIGRERMRL